MVSCGVQLVRSLFGNTFASLLLFIAHVRSSKMGIARGCAITPTPVLRSRLSACSGGREGTQDLRNLVQLLTLLYARARKDGFEERCVERRNPVCPGPNSHELESGLSGITEE